MYVQGEAGNQTLSVPTLKRGRTFHLYCSPHNAGAKELGAELVEMLSRRIANASKADSKGDSKPLLKTTTSLDELDQCEHMLIYLTAKTWCNGEDSIAYAREVAIAQRKGVHLLLAHEYPCCLDALVPGGMSRGACEFNDFWNEGWTPKHLLTGDANVYKQIAMALKPGPFRAAGLAVVLNKMGEGGGERVKLSEEDIRLSEEAEEKGLREHVPAVLQPKADGRACGAREAHAASGGTKAGGTSPEEQRGKPSAARPKSSYRAAAATGGRPKSSYRRSSSGSDVRTAARWPTRRGRPATWLHHHQPLPAPPRPHAGGSSIRGAVRARSSLPPGGGSPSHRASSKAPHRARPKSSVRASPGRAAALRAPIKGHAQRSHVFVCVCPRLLRGPCRCRVCRTPPICFSA